MSTPRHVGAFFGEPWPSGVCDEGTQVPTPVGEKCALCDEPVEEKDQGSFMGIWEQSGLAPIHRECSLRSVFGGIGHLEDHTFWCGNMHNPDGGRSYRQSSLEVWDWLQEHGVPDG